MFSRRAFMAAVAAAVVAGRRAYACVADTAVPPAFETASLLNGAFWQAATRDVRAFYVRAAHESVSAWSPRQPGGKVGFSYPQMVTWIDEFYASDRAHPALPLGVVYTYARRASHGEDRAQILTDAAAYLRRIRALEK
jgi:hypothetical protein